MNYACISSTTICNMMRQAEPSLKEVIKTMAAAESMSMSNYVNKILVEHCNRYLKIHMET